MWGWLGRAWTRGRAGIASRSRRFRNRFTEPKIKLSYFDEVLAVELHAINARRKKLADQEDRVAKRSRTKSVSSFEPVRKLKSGELSVEGHLLPVSGNLPTPDPKPSMTVNPNKPIIPRTRPQPIPCTAVGVALSGGGIRSAAFSLGALQALDYHGTIRRTDYLSTVSGGGYIGACMTASMSKNGGEFPFGGALDVRDNDAIGHIRNYSNYLMPSARSGLRNLLDGISILLRGLVANGVVILPFLLFAALATCAAYPSWDNLTTGSFVPRLAIVAPQLLWSILVYVWSVVTPDWMSGLLSGLGGVTGPIWSSLISRVATFVPQDLRTLITAAIDCLKNTPFSFTLLLALGAAVILGYWAWRRSVYAEDGNDADSPFLTFTRWFIGLTILSAFLDLQPLFISYLGELRKSGTNAVTAFLSSPVIVAAVTIALFARRLGAFLDTTAINGQMRIRILRVLTQVSLILAGMVLPLVLLVIYWHFSAWMMFESRVPPLWDVPAARRNVLFALVMFFAVMWAFEANAYSLHQFYKDRLSKAFLFEPDFKGQSEPQPLRHFKLSEINTIDCPYPIMNAALNVQGSKEANRRGRNADFFTFTPDFVGSDLTHFAGTSIVAAVTDMETIDPKLDVGSAMAISGAALSANMGSNTVRWLSPTLALLNIRLGYWLRNPRDLAKQRKFLRPREWLYNFIGKFYLLLEMFNFLDEDKSFIYLSDGGHIENLGIYQLIKRGCLVIIAVDAEADPKISCASLLKLERYARIDLGVRIILPWEQIAARNRATNAAIDPRTPDEAVRHRGQHCAVGRILYEDGSRGILIYFKSSLSGDEKDYVLDYKKRNQDFPHETTGDQFFTEEQFEVYRTLGYHIVEGFFSGTDAFAWQDGPHGWKTADDAKIDALSAIGI